MALTVGIDKVEATGQGTIQVWIVQTGMHVSRLVQGKYSQSNQAVSTKFTRTFGPIRLPRSPLALFLRLVYESCGRVFQPAVDRARVHLAWYRRQT